MPCDEHGAPLPPNAPPPPLEPLPDYGDWWPYENRVQFEAADLLFTRDQMPAGKIDDLLNVWAASLAPHHDAPPFKDHKELYSTIDATPIPGGDANWETFNLCFRPPDEDLPPDAANWKKTKWDVWYRDPRKLIDNMLQNPDFRNEFDYIPHQEYDLDGNHRFHNVMSGDWCWREAVSNIIFLSLQRLTSVPECHRQRSPHSR